MNGSASRETLTECGCGARYTAEQFAQLEQRGVQDNEGLAADLHLANCGCGSTIGREVKVTKLARPLCALDLLTGIASVPTRVVEQEWVETPGRPDAVRVTISTGAIYELQPELGTGGHCDVIPLNAAARAAHLPNALYRQLADAAYERFSADMQEVES